MNASAYPNVYHGTLLDEIIHEQKLSAELVKKAAREVFAIIKEGLVRDGVVRINHFGTFKLKRVATRKGRNPQTGETITIPGRAKVIFSPCKALREMIEPVHAKPIPIPKPVTEAIKPAAAARVAVQPVPELIPEPALLKTESEANIAIERIDDFDEEPPQQRKRGRQEKLIYFGIAATIIAVIAIKSMPRDRVDTLSDSVNQAAGTTPMVVVELELKSQLSP
ncbi:MAG: HU family DNA-binding protein, partial [Gammaproteobacteria bacterium]|nr:HU family DNA-binding protein [Gammaproteobacteria bacterium]